MPKHGTPQKNKRTLKLGYHNFMEGGRRETLAVRGQINTRRILGVVCVNVPLLPPYSPSPIPYISILVHVVVVSITSIKMNKTSKKKRKNASY